jgi:hypothetical protein
MFSRFEDPASGGASLPPGWLANVPSGTCATARAALERLTQSLAPPGRADIATQLPITAAYIEAQVRSVTAEMLAHPPPGVGNIEHAVMIALYTIDGPIYRVMNAWGFHDGRSVNDMHSVAPAYKLLLRSLRACSHLLYRGPAVRVVDATRNEYVKRQYTNYENELKVGAAVNFYGFASFGRDEKKLNGFIGGQDRQIIVFSCDAVVGYDINELSMIPRLGGAAEDEILVPCPSFFTVNTVPRKIRNTVFVSLKFNEELSASRSYLASCEEDVPSASSDVQASCTADATGDSDATHAAEQHTCECPNEVSQPGPSGQLERFDDPEQRALSSALEKLPISDPVKRACLHQLTFTGKPYPHGAVNCDVCATYVCGVSLEGPQYLHCSKCEFDVCPGCLEQYDAFDQRALHKTLEAMPIVDPAKRRCSHQPVLTSTPYSHGHVTCDVCSTTVFNPSFSARKYLHCSECEFDACPSCLDLYDEPKQQALRSKLEAMTISDPMKSRCAHRLLLTGKPYSHGAVSCDVCGTYVRDVSPEGPQYLHCTVCEFDACPACLACTHHVNQ